MLPSRLGYRIVTEHGLIYNVLSALPLEAQITLACLSRRTYNITVPFNIAVVKQYEVEVSNFPVIDKVSEDFICKISRYVTIEGKTGSFYGPVNKASG